VSGTERDADVNGKSLSELKSADFARLLNDNAASVSISVLSGMTWNEWSYDGDFVVFAGEPAPPEEPPVDEPPTDEPPVDEPPVVVPPSYPTGSGGGAGTVISVVPEEETPLAAPSTGTGDAWASPFGDVKASDWFYADVEYAVQNGLFNGTSADAFSPNAPMTRGMIVTVLGRLYGADESAYTAGSFSDVAAGQYYAAYVEWAKDSGIANGVGDGLFAPNADVSRQDFATLLMRYADVAQKQFPATRQFSVFADDADIADYAKSAVQTLYNGGIINGVGGNAVNPKGQATRAEVAAMLHRFIEAAN
jgi:hypothetical protein